MIKLKRVQDGATIYIAPEAILAIIPYSFDKADVYVVGGFTLDVEWTKGKADCLEAKLTRARLSND